MSGVCNWEKCMLNSDVHIVIDGRMTTSVNKNIRWHVKSSLVYGGVTSRFYPCFECRQTPFGGFVPCAEIVSYMLSIAVNTSNVLTQAAAYLFECTVFQSVSTCSSFPPC
jgi:hypothetical protein